MKESTLAEVQELCELSSRTALEYGKLAQTAREFDRDRSQYVMIAAMHTQNMLLCEILARLMEKSRLDEPMKFKLGHWVVEKGSRARGIIVRQADPRRADWIVDYGGAVGCHPAFEADMELDDSREPHPPPPDEA